MATESEFHKRVPPGWRELVIRDPDSGHVLGSTWVDAGGSSVSHPDLPTVEPIKVNVVAGERVDATVSTAVDHPAHYGGADNPYEAIKVIEAWGLGFCLGNAVKYISRAGEKVNHTLGQGEDNARLEDLQKARWYVDREIGRLEREARGDG